MVFGQWACVLWPQDVGKGGGSLDFVYFWVCGIWVCVLSGLRTWARREDRPVGGGAGGFHFHQSSARVRRSPTEGELACLLLLM